MKNERIIRNKQIRDLARAMYQQRYGGKGLTYFQEYWEMCAAEALDGLKALGYSEVA